MAEKKGASQQAATPPVEMCLRDESHAAHRYWVKGWSEERQCPGFTICTLPTYLSWGTEGDDGPWVERAECDGPRPCGFDIVIVTCSVPSSGGANSDTWAALEAQHRQYSKTPSAVAKGVGLIDQRSAGCDQDTAASSDYPQKKENP